jgi:hypothetical protein
VYSTLLYSTLLYSTLLYSTQACDWSHTLNVWDQVYPSIGIEGEEEYLDADEEEEEAEVAAAEDDDRAEDEEIEEESMDDENTFRDFCENDRETSTAPAASPTPSNCSRWTHEELEQKVMSAVALSATVSPKENIPADFVGVVSPGRVCWTHMISKWSSYLPERTPNDKEWNADRLRGIAQRHNKKTKTLALEVEEEAADLEEEEKELAETEADPTDLDLRVGMRCWTKRGDVIISRVLP